MWGVRIALVVLSRAAWAAPERLAVLEFSGATLRPEQLRLITDAARGAALQASGGRFTVMTRENMEVMLTDMGVDPGCVAEGACEVETARNLGVDWVISGEVVVMPDLWVASVKLHDTRSGALLASEQARARDVVGLLDATPPVTRGLLTHLPAPEVPVPAQLIGRLTRNPIGPGWASADDLNAGAVAPFTLSQAALLQLASRRSASCRATVRSYRKDALSPAWPALGALASAGAGLGLYAAIQDDTWRAVPLAVGGGMALGFAIFAVLDGIRPADVDGVLGCVEDVPRADVEALTR
jgi:hypothetical protein